MKRLVVCCDGTWNTPRTNTNIFRTYAFLREVPQWWFLEVEAAGG